MIILCAKNLIKYIYVKVIYMSRASFQNLHKYA